MPRGSCILSGTYETIKHAIPIRIRSDRKTPHGGQAPETPRVSECEQKRRIGAGDQQVDRRVIADPQAFLQALGLHRVVQRRGQVQHDHRTDKDHRPRHLTSAAAAMHGDVHAFDSAQAQKHSRAMRDRVGHFIAQRRGCSGLAGRPNLIRGFHRRLVLA